MSSKRALVLGGGGPVGVIWESAVLRALQAAGLCAGDADLILGTSAGAIVGTRLLRGFLNPGVKAPPGALPCAPEGGFDEKRCAGVYHAWADAELEPEERSRRVASLARGSRTVDEALWREHLRGWIGGEQWPEGALRITAVDARSGARVTFRTGQSRLLCAIAASCAVPGWAPEIQIDGAHYIDGGVYSSTHADLALDVEPERVLVLAPLVRPGHGPQTTARERLRWELETLRRAGVRHVQALTPDEEDERCFGPNMMQPDLAALCRSGQRRGEELAAALRATW